MIWTIICTTILLFLIIFLRISVRVWLTFRKKLKTLKWIKSMKGLPIVGDAFRFGDNTETINDLMKIKQEYGNLVIARLVTDIHILVYDYDFLEFLLSSQNIISKSHDYGYFRKWLGTGLLLSDGSKWKKRRRLLTPSFHFSILENFVETFDRNSNILIEKLKATAKQSSEAIDIYPFITAFALDVICEAAMGISVNAQECPNQPYVKSVKAICHIISTRAFSVLKRFDFFYKFSRDYRKENKYLKNLHGYTNSVIQKRLQELKNNNFESIEDNDVAGKKKMAFLDILIHSTIDGQPLSQEDIREEVDTFMFEGHDTSASAITFACYLLANHPDVQKKVLEEQELIFANNRNRIPTYQDLQNMKYLEVVIKETLRLYPSVPIIERKTTEECEYKGNKIPKDVSITVFIYGMNREPKYFKDPDTFDPNRFKSMDGKNPYCYIPFSAGPRNCIGQRFAMLEMKCTLSKIVRNLELLPCVPKHEVILVNEVILKSLNGVKIRIKTRNNK